jgi:hypothetical protein
MGVTSSHSTDLQGWPVLQVEGVGNDHWPLRVEKLASNEYSAKCDWVVPPLPLMNWQVQLCTGSVIHTHQFYLLSISRRLPWYLFTDGHNIQFNKSRSVWLGFLSRQNEQCMAFIRTVFCMHGQHGQPMECSRDLSHLLYIISYYI